MKFKTTAKAVKENYATILRVGYCELQRLLRDENPVAYSAGTYGWNFDLYDVSGVAICTGYRGMPGADVPYEIVKRYESIAESDDAEQDGDRDRRKSILYTFILAASKAIEAEKASKRSKKVKV